MPTSSARASRPVFLSAVLILLFIASLAIMLAWGQTMSAMGALPMPGGWMLSMAWSPLCGQTWTGTALGFLGMWAAMMTAMMLPPLAPVLWRYHQAVAGPDDRFRPDLLALLAGAGYFAVWIIAGVAIFPPGAALAAAALEWSGLARALPLVSGAVVLIAGIAQFSGWKARQLACCRMAPGCGCGPVGIGAAWRHGLRLGLRCLHCCVGPTAVLLAAGVMDLTVMTAVVAAICLERLMPDGARLARVTGGIAVLAGVTMILQAVWSS
jgi:predicted metal-binding membrane protein